MMLILLMDSKLHGTVSTDILRIKSPLLIPESSNLSRDAFILLGHSVPLL